jgi:hypothetical protein
MGVFPRCFLGRFLGRFLAGFAAIIARDAPPSKPDAPCGAIGAPSASSAIGDWISGSFENVPGELFVSERLSLAGCGELPRAVAPADDGDYAPIRELARRAAAKRFAPGVPVMPEL